MISDKDIEEIFEKKRARRMLLAKLPIEEKVKILIKLQKIAEPLLKDRGQNVIAWNIDDEDKYSNSEKK